jgi:hypothetical protein
VNETPTSAAPPPLDPSHASRKEALDVVRPLLAAEETRSANLNARALGMITASSIVTAVAGLFAKDVLGNDAATLKRLGDSRDPALALLMASVFFLVLTVCLGVYALWPRRRQFIRSDPKIDATKEAELRQLATTDHLESWKHGDVANEDEIRKWALAATATVLADLRKFNGSKVLRLRAVYCSYAFAVVLIAADAGLFFLAGFSANEVGAQ